MKDFIYLVRRRCHHLKKKYVYDVEYSLPGPPPPPPHTHTIGKKEKIAFRLNEMTGLDREKKKKLVGRKILKETYCFRTKKPENKLT